MKARLATAALALAASTAGAIEVDSTRWFAAFYGAKAPQPELLLLSRSPCRVPGTAAKGWKSAVELQQNNQPGERFILACWRSDPGGEPMKQYCHIDYEGTVMHEACLWIPDNRFVDTRTLPRQAPAY